MPHKDSLLTLRCPRCELGEAALFIGNRTVLTCTRCGHTWGADMSDLPGPIRRVVHAINRTRMTPEPHLRHRPH